MENASEALMMAFGVLIFVLALTVAINSFSQARAVSDEIIYMTDETNYYDYEETTGASQSRIVGLETIIPTLYKYKKEDYIVLFREAKTYDRETGEFTNVQPLKLYRTRTDRKWNQDNEEYCKFINENYSKFFNGYNWTYDSTNIAASNCYDIFCFDVLLEDKRNEPWTGNDEQIKENIRCFLQGDIYIDPAFKNNTDESVKKYREYINYKRETFEGTGGGFINWATYDDKKFVETVGEYSYSRQKEKDTDDASLVSELVYEKTKKKRIIIYTYVKEIIN